MKMPGFNAEAALPSGDQRYLRIAPNDKSGEAPRVVLSSFWDIAAGALTGFVAGGPVGAIVGGAAGAAASGGGGPSLCYPIGPCIDTGIRFAGIRIGTQGQICVPGGFSTIPCIL